MLLAIWQRLAYALKERKIQYNQVKNMDYVAVSGGNFIDEHGRALLLRGVNLGGSSKVPAAPDGRSHLAKGFYNGRELSFVGRPFPLGEADAHFSRLARWGQRFVRLLVTWEAVEHTGPGIYDTAYLDYLEGIVESAARNGIALFIDPHQDVWSRWTGGDGAPMWTLEALGFEPRNLHASGAAMLHQGMGESYPQMQWFSNHLRLACATMFTVFFAGNDFAPGILAEGEPIQEFLQRHYLEAMAQVARRLARYANVAGLGSMNEPGEGFIGIADAGAARNDLLMPGLAPTPWEAMRAGEGLPVEATRIGVRGGSLRSTGRVMLGTPGVRAWKEGEACVWRRVGLWDIEGGRAVLKKPRWFSEGVSNGFGAYRATEAESAPGAMGGTSHTLFNERYLKPFVQRFAVRMEEVRMEEVRKGQARIGTEGSAPVGQAHQNAAPGTAQTLPFLIFVESSPLGELPHFEESPWLVNEAHWYDSFTLSLKRWTGFLAYDPEARRLIVGPRAVRHNFVDTLSRIVRHSRERMGGCPTLLGEFGLPYDINGGSAYRTGNFSTHERALSAYYDALDANLLSATIWNYTADNSHARGDGWNSEDLSVYCVEDGGGRALRGFVRPYAMAVAGTILRMRFSARRGVFELEFAPDHRIDAPTLVYVPMLQFPRGAIASVEGASISEPGLKIGDKKALTLPPVEDEGFFVLNIRAAPDSERCGVRIVRAGG